MRTLAKGFVELVLFVVLLGLIGCASTSKSMPGEAMPADKAVSGTIVIDETQIMWMVGGDIGGGMLQFQDQSYKFKLGGLKLGGFGVHKDKLVGDVYNLTDVADFAGLYGEAEAGFTVGDVGKGAALLENDKGVKLHLKSPEAEGIALAVGLDGVDIRMEE